MPTLDVKLVANQLSNVTCIANAGDSSGRLFIVEQAGRIKIFDGTTVLATPFLNIGPMLLNSGEQGLLGLAFHPGYATNGAFYVYFTNPNGSSNVVARFTNSPPSAAVVNTNTLQTVLRIAHPSNSNHNGGDLHFGPDGYLYIAPGDGGSCCDPPNNAQTLGTLLGKMLRIDVNDFSTNYTIPPSNPFVATNGARPEVWAYGLRNPWRFSFDRVTGDLFVGDVGQNFREEVNFQSAGSAGGQNYGWRLMEGLIPGTNSCNGGTLCGVTVTYSNLTTTLPILDYDHSGGRVAVTGGYRYRGTAIPPLVGTYLFADEKSSGPIYGATQSLAGVWSFAMTNNTPYTITTFGEDQSGEVYFSNYANNTGGAVYRLVWRDTDGDGVPDDNEVLAGTDTNNPASFLRITATGPSNTDWSITFSTVSNKLYRLERTDDLAVTNWVSVTNNISGTGSPLQILDPGGASQTQRFYRVRLLP